MPVSPGFRGVLLYEFLRLVRKKSFWFVVALFVLPVILAVALKNYLDVPENPRVWVEVFGLDVVGFMGGTASGGAILFNATSLLGLAWLVAILYGGDVFAGDMQDGTIRLILARPLSRLTYTAAKLSAVTMLMVFFFLLGGISTYAAAWIVAGPQEGFVSMLGYSILIGLGITPLLYASALLGAYTRKPVTGILLGFVGYMAGGIPSALLVVLSVQGSIDMGILDARVLGSAVTPFTAGQSLASTLYTYLNGGPEITVPGVSGTEVFHAYTSTVLTVASLVGWNLLLLTLTVRLLSRRDL